jgi:hypothetical protein
MPVCAITIGAALLLVMTSCGDDNGGESSTSSESGPSVDEFDAPFGDVDAYPVLASSEVVVGSNRFILGLLDGNDAPIGEPRIDVGIEFFDLSDGVARPSGKAQTDFVWSVEGERGVYVTNARFDHPGKWGAEVSIDGQGLSETVRISFDVIPEPSSVALGTVPPASDTPTADDVKRLSEITTDPEPDPFFYRLSISEALEGDEPFVVVFATPKFCTSAVCGPTLDIVESVARDFPHVNFIHVEVYENLDDPSNLKPVPAVQEWGLPSEPWVFVVGSDDKVLAKYEGVVGADELRKELSSLKS